MPQLREVTGTAFVVAELRADENGAAAPLYQDSVVGLFLNDTTREAAAAMAATFPLVKEMVKVRTKYLDDVLEQHLLAHFRQVVILGAGLDTRAVRKQSPGVTYFEIDDPGTLKLKEICYEQQGLDVNVRFIPGNYVRDGVVDLLKRNGFDFNVPTYWPGRPLTSRVFDYYSICTVGS